MWWEARRADSNDDTALPKSGSHSVGVAPQSCGAQRRVTNCQAPVILTLADGRVCAPLGMRLFLPRVRTDDEARCAAAGIPAAQQAFASKQHLALAELDRVRHAGVMSGTVVADAGYGSSTAFRHGFTARELCWALRIASHHGVDRLDVTLAEQPKHRTGRPAKHPVPSEAARPIHDVLACLPPHHWHTVKGAKKSRWVMVRPRLAERPGISRGVRLPGEDVWVIGEQRRGEEIKDSVSTLPAGTSKAALARLVCSRWACDVNHGQAKEELGLDHFEGRSWRGLRPGRGFGDADDAVPAMGAAGDAERIGVRVHGAGCPTGSEPNLGGSPTRSLSALWRTPSRRASMTLKGSDKVLHVFTSLHGRYPCWVARSSSLFVGGVESELGGLTFGHVEVPCVRAIRGQRHPCIRFIALECLKHLFEVSGRSQAQAARNRGEGLGVLAIVGDRFSSILSEGTGGRESVLLIAVVVRRCGLN